MNMENLMEKRVIVIADYPNAFAKVGTIWGNEGDNFIQHHDELDYEKYPHLFRPLRWWEFRDDSEMPLYVKAYHNEFYKVDCWGRMGYNPERTIAVVDNNMKINAIDLTPATEQQYLTYINSK